MADRERRQHGHVVAFDIDFKHGSCFKRSFETEPLPAVSWGTVIDVLGSRFVASINTKERIIEAAERLFADSGFNGTSLRQLTRAANVNLAAVNYHFGSKEMLIRDVFKRRLDALNRARQAALDELEGAHDGPPPLESVLRAFIEPALSMSADAANGGSPFVKVLARAYVEYREELRNFLSEQYGELNSRFFHAIAAHLAHLSDAQIYLRIDFMVGALTYAMADFGVSKRPRGLSVEEFWHQAADEMVHFAASGLAAPA